LLGFQGGFVSYIEGKNKTQVLNELAGTAQVGSQIHEQQKAALTVLCTEDIEASLKSLENQLKLNSESSDKVGNKIFWLNVVLALATIVGAVATAFIAIKT
jgi:hypothetical protein